MDKKLKEQLNLAFSAPEPTRKDMFLKKLRPREITTTELLIQQVPYVRKAVWVFAFMIITVTVIGAFSMNSNTERIIESLVPLAAVASTLEIQRSYRYQMTELEMATRFSIRSVFYARMVIIGLVYATTFCIILPVIAVRFGTGFILLASRILIPYLITTSLCMRLERTTIGRSNHYLSAAVASGIAICIFWMSSYELSGLTNFITEWGVVMVILLIILAIYENRKTINMTEGFA